MRNDIGDNYFDEMRKTANSSISDVQKPRRVRLMVGMDHAHGRSILEGIADYADHHVRWQHRLEVLLSPELVSRGGVDGMIVEMRDQATIAALRRARFPTIAVAGEQDPKGPPAVVVDNRAVGRLGCEHLADLGLKHLAFVPHGAGGFSVLRREGFAAGCAARRIKCSFYDGSASDEEALAAWVRSLPDPAGIMAANDREALFVSRACRLAGRHIPEQVALLGVDNEIETCRLADPPLSSIDHGTRRIGYEAAKLLDGWMTTGRRPAGNVFIQPVGVVSRQSTDLLAVKVPDVAAALRFIRGNADRPLKVKQVLEHIAMSRRSLELHFQAAIGRSIHAEITRVRIERAKQLLITSDWSMPHVADACGFAFPSQFSHVFRRYTGLPPIRFRQQFRYQRD